MTIRRSHLGVAIAALLLAGCSSTGSPADSVWSALSGEDNSGSSGTSASTGSTVTVIPPDGERNDRFWIVGNNASQLAKSSPIRINRVDGLVVWRNRQPLESGELVMRAAIPPGAHVDADLTYHPPPRPAAAATQAALPL